MKYVYLLQSTTHPNETYIGLTDDLRSRFNAHNTGRSIHTNKFKPWRLVTYIAFSDGEGQSPLNVILRQHLAEHSPTSVCAKPFG